MESQHEANVSNGEPSAVQESRERKQGPASTIELQVRNLSISFVPQPSLVVAGARSIKKGLQKAWAQCARKKQELTEHGNSCVGAVSQDPSDVGLSILRNINLHVKPGQVCVLLGSSGAGKTTLLNALAGRMEWGQVAMTGQITFNGEKAKKYWKSPKLGYLYQDDHLEPYLTPRETLEFVSKLHEGTIRTTPEMTQKIERLLTILGLKDCADRRVGVTGGAQSASVGGAGGSQVSSRQQKGISGGEKRRVSVAVQLLKDPSILFCDEPTSGLDSFASYEVMKALVSLAKTESKTVICSIHQPRSEIFELLAKNDGQLVLLSLGSVVYSGPIASAMDWFESQEGLPPCPKDLNQFDFMIDWSSIDFSSEQQEHASHERRQRLVSAWAEFSKMTTMTNFDTQTVSSKEHISLPVTEEQSSSSYVSLQEEQANGSEDGGSTMATKKSNVGVLAWRMVQRTSAHLVVLTKRGMQAQMRNKWWLNAYLLVNILLGLWIGGLFSHPSETYLGIRGSRCLLMILSSFQPLLYMIVLLYRLSKEIRVFDRERKDGWYGPFPFLTSTLLKSFPLALIGTLIYANIVFFMAKMWIGINSYVLLMATLLALQIAVCSFPFIFASLFRGFITPATFFFGSFCGMTLASGDYVPSDKIPVHYIWLKYTTVFGETLKVLSSIQFTDRIFDCPYETSFGVRDAERCRWYNGNDILDLNGHIKPHYYPGPILFVVVYGIAYSLACWIILVVKVVEPAVPVETTSILKVLLDFFIAPFLSKDPIALARKKRKAELTNRRIGRPYGSESTIALPTPTSLQDSALDQMSPTDEQKKQQQDESSTNMDATRIHIYEQGLARCDPVEIRADRLSLTLTTRRRIWRAAQRPEDKDVGMQWSSCQLWRTVETKNTLLKDLNLKFAPGQLTAIIGSSGAGKTSLLSVLLDRTSPNLQVHGDVWYNGTKNPTLRQVNSVCGYVRQDDTHLLPNLTLREMMRYNAELSMDRKMTKHEKWEKVEAIIELMGLAECADVVIGDSDNTGCSGGQRRRVSIALQLIIEPPCLVLDEPTTGLDAMSALTIVQTLKAIARTGRTVICTIHQPRSAIWKEFDNVVLLMPGGQLGYAGPRENVLDFFSYAGFSPEACTNTPDFVIDTASVDFGSEATELESRQRMDAIANKFQAYRARQNGNSSHNSREGDKRQGLEESEFKNSSNGSDGDQELKTELATKAPHFAPWTHAIPILTRRMFFNVFRERTLFFNRMCLGLVAGLIPALMFTLLDRTPMGLLTRVGYFQQFVYLSAAAVVGVVGLFPRDKEVAFHEVSNGLYSASSFLTSYIINEIPHGLVASVLVTSVHFILVPLERNWISVGVFYFVIFSYYVCGESIALLIGTWTDSEYLTIVGGIAFALINSATNGLLNSQLPLILKWFSKISIWTFGMNALAIVEYSNIVVECTPEETRLHMCPVRNGKEVLEMARMDKHSLAECLAYIALLTVFYRSVMWVGLIARVKRERW